MSKENKIITHECKNCEGTWSQEPYGHCPYCHSVHIKTELKVAVIGGKK